MITKKEMGYINSWPNKTPYPGEDYCRNILNKLKKCYDLYNSKYLNRRYTIQFSNNEEVDMAILEKNVAHLLGIDFKNITNDYFYDYRYDILEIYDDYVNSYLILSKIIENAENVIEYDKTNGKCSAINYYKVGIKCDIFSKLADLSNFHYGCINFNKDKYDENYPEMPFTPQSTKLLFTPSDEVVSPYFLMGIKKEDFVDSYIVETLMAADNPIKFFNSQEVIIPTQVLTDNNGILDKNVATSAEKIKLIREYQNIINEYNIPNNLNIFGDYFSKLMSDKNEEESQMKLKK